MDWLVWMCTTQGEGFQLHVICTWRPIASIAQCALRLVLPSAPSALCEQPRVDYGMVVSAQGCARDRALQWDVVLSAGQGAVRSASGQGMLTCQVSMPPAVCCACMVAFCALLVPLVELSPVCLLLLLQAPQLRPSKTCLCELYGHVVGLHSS